jgi:hypothetical protein
MRALGVVSLVCSLVAGLYLAAAQMSSTGTAGPAGDKAKKDAAIVAATFAARQGEAALDLYRRTTGTYAGASLDGVSGVELLRADSTSYCLKMHVADYELYDQGPGGEVGPQPCA